MTNNELNTMNYENMSEDELNNEIVVIEKDLKVKNEILNIVQGEYNSKTREILVLERDKKDKEIAKRDLLKSLNTQKHLIRQRESDKIIATRLYWNKRKDKG